MLLECGKQDLNLHGLAATRPSTGGGIFHKSLWHNDKRRRYKDLGLRLVLSRSL